MLITDLDTTLIYSKGRLNTDKVVGVEKLNGFDVSFMTEEARDLINSINFIPCTMRQIDMVHRLDLPKTDFIISDNGAKIWENGRLNIDYDSLMKKHVFQDVEIVREIMKDVMYEKEFCNNISFMYIIQDVELDMEELRNKIPNTFNVHAHRSASQNHCKLYITPAGLNKAVAVDYLIEKYDLKNLITSGDDLVDEEFVKRGLPILPKHAMFKNEKAIYTENEGVLAGEEILKKVKSMS